MDHNRSDNDSWVENQLASLEPEADWQDNADRVLEDLKQRKTSPGPHWMRVGMTATILATTAVVLVLLPWQGLWKAKPDATVKVVSTIAKQSEKQETPKPAEEPQVQPKPSAEVKATSAPKQEEEQRQRVPVRLDDPPQFFEVVNQYSKAERQFAQAPQTDVQPPKVLNKVFPEYTDEARQAKITGTVEMMITVKTDGTVQFEKFVRTLGYGLDEKARDAIEQWVFTPGTKDGVPVATTSNISINFSLR